MKGGVPMAETGNFKSRLFGGFDRQDVSDYITTLARERNRLRTEVETLRSENEALKARAEAAEASAEAEKRRAEDFVISERAAARDELQTLCDKYAEVRSDLDVTATHVRCEILRLADNLTLLTGVFGQAGERFEELRGLVSDESDAPEETADGTEDI